MNIHVPEVDYLRAFAILAVLAIHVSGGFDVISVINPLMVTNITIDIFAHFAVPLFIFISGFLLYLKYQRKYSLKEFYLKRFWRIIPPYLIFTTFYLVFTCVIASFKTGTLTLPSGLHIMYAYLAAGGYFHLWFFLIIIELYLLYPLIVKVYHFFTDRKQGFLFLLICFMFQEGWKIFGQFFKLHIFGFDVSITDKIFLICIFYFALGIFICDHYQKIKDWVLCKSVWIFIVPVILFTALGSVLWVSGIYFYGSIDGGLFSLAEALIQPIYYLFTFSLLFVISNKIAESKGKCKWLLTISLYSFGIYLIHPFFQVGVVNLLKFAGITQENAIYYPITYIAILLLSMIFVYIVRKLPFSKYIIG